MPLPTLIKRKLGELYSYGTSGFQSMDVRDDEGHCRVTALASQGAMKILNIYAPNNKTAKPMKAKMDETTSNRSLQIHSEISVPLSVTDRASRQ